ncbi:hypothetical protein [Achromobacter ruhlandii]|uniref:Uncharacterized protein n=1 Tax=Achromobacter ruhlandii TaxID=72557 RepID=A0ABM8M0Y2_9BURK|nr:hypothetical protein [Achromobacter ruhlandii]CAB3956101.1 hypothetical protein LMG7053_04903 [Achromobacter ruhlandii]
MAVYLVTYDLNKETKRPPIVDEVKKIADGWAKLSESSYAIVFNGPPGDVYALLTPMLDDNDALYVISLRQPFDGQGPEAVNTWLVENLPAN